MAWCENLEEFIKNLDPDNLELPDDFDPTFTVYCSTPMYRFKRQWSSMNFWVKHHPNHDVPNEITLPLETFVESYEILSPLSTWIMNNKTGTIPPYLLPYSEMSREESDFRSCVSEWVIFRDDDIPVELEDEIVRCAYWDDFFSFEPYNLNAASAWIYFKEDRPLPKVLWPSLDDFGDENICRLTKFWIINHPGEPLPPEIERVARHEEWEHRDPSDDFETSFVILWMKHRPSEKIPRILFSDPVFWCNIQSLIEYKLCGVNHCLSGNIDFTIQLTKLVLQYHEKR